MNRVGTTELWNMYFIIKLTNNNKQMFSFMLEQGETLFLTYEEQKIHTDNYPKGMLRDWLTCYLNWTHFTHQQP